MPQTSGPAVDLIEHAAGVIVAKMDEPHTAPYHWADALWEAGMLHSPGSLPLQNEVHLAAALRGILADRERELLALKGPCSTSRCRLHYAHSGPCDTRPARTP